MNLGVRQKYEKRWEEIKFWEDLFLNSPSIDYAGSIKGFWNDWLTECADVAGYKGLAKQRIEMYSSFARGTMSKDEILEEIKRDRNKYFR
jgi:hypothetical protein